MENKKPSYIPGGYREVLTIAYPLIMSTASMTIMHFVDRVFLARYAKEAIAASVPAGITSFTIICLFMGISGYTNAIVAQHYYFQSYFLYSYPFIYSSGTNYFCVSGTQP